MRGRIALQSTACEIQWRSLVFFAPALGVRTRPRVALMADFITSPFAIAPYPPACHPRADR
jgi:hypothetical protein